MKRIFFLNLLTIALFLTFSCRKEQYRAPTVSGIGEETIIMNIGEKMILAPNVTNLKGNNYTWMVNGKEAAKGQLQYTFAATEPGNFEVTFKADNKGGADMQSFKIKVEEEIAIAIENGLSVPMCNVIEITPTVTGPERDDYEYEWLIEDSVIGKKLNLHFISSGPGTYELTLRATAGKQTTTATSTINVSLVEEYNKNAYTVVEYLPSPGKNHNWSVVGSAENWKYWTEFPHSYTAFLAKASELRKSTGNYSLFLGGWGGSATFKFDHTVVNAPGKPDLEMTATHSNLDLPAIYVAWDRNKNGIADEDEWYEIKNADYGIEDIPEYEITFTYDRTETDDRRFYSYFTWKDNQEEPASGEIVTNKTFTSSTTIDGVYSTRGFFPGLNVIDQASKTTAVMDGWPSSFTRKGKRITRDLSGAPQFYQTRNIDIDLAVDRRGEPVLLPGIDFIRVQKVIYPFSNDFNDGNKYKDFNMEDRRMLQVNYIWDKHLSK